MAQKTIDFEDDILGPIGSLKEDLSNKITKFYASNQGETHITDSDNGKIEDMVLYGKSEQKQYKGINLLPPNNKYGEYVEVSIPKGSLVFWITDGTPANGGNFRFYNEDKTEDMWFEIDAGTTSKKMTLKVDAKYVQNLVSKDFDLSKICLGIGNTPTYEPYVGGQPSPSPEYPQKIKSVVNPTVKVTNEDGLKVQSVTLNNITLNAIPVSSGGNVTINGQQYVSDYVDVERGKVVRMTELIEYDGTENWSLQSINNNGIANFQIIVTRYISSIGMCDTLQLQKTIISNTNTEGFMINNNNSLFIRINTTRGISTLETFKEFLANKHIFILYALSTPTEIDLVKEEITAFKALSTYYPKTYVTAESEQLNAYTMFSYPVSMEKGWEYVKQQIGDTRKYVYDMDLQSAEAYVNSEYAVALTELEV